MLKIPEWTYDEMKQTGVDYSNVLGLRSRAPSMVAEFKQHTSTSGDSAEPVNKRFAGKRYLVLITIKNFENIEPFKIG